MIPVILCGGYSTRMGLDKCLMTWNDRPVVQYILDVLHTSVPTPPLLSIRMDQEIAYRKLFSGTIVIDQSELIIQGPLLGILSAYLSHRGKDLFVIAGDMPFVSGNLVNRILLEQKAHPTCDIIACKHHDRIEPLCGMYTHQCLEKVYSHLIPGTWPNHSMMHLIEVMDSYIIDISDEKDIESFTNLNSKQDIDQKLKSLNDSLPASGSKF